METIKLDYTIDDPQERLKLVNKILESSENPPNERYLEILADYLIFCMEKKERLSHKITTENRQATIDKRETSWQQLAEKLDNGDDGIYNISNHARGKALLLQPKVSITKKDLEEIAELRQLRKAIDSIDRQVKEAPTGRNKFILKSTLIEMRRSQYIIKDAFRKPLYPNKLIHTYHSLEMPEEVYFDNKGFPCSKQVSFLNKTIVREILNNYERLKLEAADRI